VRSVASEATIVKQLRGFISPTHKLIEGRAPVWRSEFTTKVVPKGGFSGFHCGAET